MRKNFLLTILCVFVLFVMVGCNFDSFFKDDDNENKPIEEIEIDNGLGKDYYDEVNSSDMYDDFFDLSNKLEIKINISKCNI